MALSGWRFCIGGSTAWWVGGLVDGMVWAFAVEQFGGAVVLWLDGLAV